MKTAKIILKLVFCGFFKCCLFLFFFINKIALFPARRVYFMLFVRSFGKESVAFVHFKEAFVLKKSFFWKKAFDKMLPA